MNQLWTIIFITIVIAAFAVACLHDWEDGKRRVRRAVALEERSRDEESFHAGHIPAGGEEEMAGAGEELSVGEDERQAAHTRG